MFRDDLSEFDDAREVVQQVQDEYIAAESPGYVSYGAAAAGGAAVAAGGGGGARAPPPQMAPTDAGRDARAAGGAGGGLQGP